MTQALKARGRSSTWYVSGIIASGAVVVAYSAVDLIRHPLGFEWLILLAVTMASGWATLVIPGMPISFSISDTFSIAAVLLFGPSAGVITSALDGLVLTSRFERSRRSANRMLFNMAAPAIAIFGAAHVYLALEGIHPALDGPMAVLRLLVALLLFGMLAFALNSGIVAAAISFERGVPVLAIWKDHLAGMWITYFGGIFGAMLVMLLARFSTLETLILIIPLPVILYVTFRHALGRAQDQIDHLGKVNRVYVGAIEALAHAVDAKDQVTHDHTRRVQDRAVRLAQALSVADEGEIQAIKAAALLHDVGKLAIPEHVLNKPGRLTPAEYDIMKRHAAIGADILSVIGLPYDVAPIVRHHHENWDGSGYPDGLSGDRIPIGSRIVSVVDCFDALTSDRPYRPRMQDSDALQILSDRRGSMYDPRVVDAFFALQIEDTTVATTPESVPTPPAAGSTPGPPAARAEEVRADLDLQTFFRLGHGLNRSTSIAQVGETLWTHLKQHLPASAFVLYRYDEKTDAILPAFIVSDETTGLDTTPITLGDRLSGWVAASGQTMMNTDARLDLAESVRERSPLRSAMSVPIVSNGRPLGVLSFYAETVNAFDDGHRRLVEAASAAIAEPFVDRLTELTT